MVAGGGARWDDGKYYIPDVSEGAAAPFVIHTGSRLSPKMTNGIYTKSDGKGGFVSPDGTKVVASENGSMTRALFPKY